MRPGGRTALALVGIIVVLLLVPTTALPQAVFLDSGARVRAHIDTATVTGRVLVPFTPSRSKDLVLCDERRSGCIGIDSSTTLPVTRIKRLSVWGKETGFLGLLGLYLGGITGASLHASDDADRGGKMFLGFIVGGALGAAIGSRLMGWVPVFPCFHACAAGRYPQHPSR